MDSNTDVKIKKENIKGFAEGIKKRGTEGRVGTKEISGRKRVDLICLVAVPNCDYRKYFWSLSNMNA